MYRHLVPSLFLASLAAAEPADPAPLVDLTVHDLQRTIARFAEGPYGKAWNAPALAPARKELTKQLRAAGDADPGQAMMLAAWDAGLSGISWQAAEQSGLFGSAVELRGTDLFNRLAQQAGLSLDGWMEVDGNIRFVSGDCAPQRQPPMDSDDDMTLRWFPKTVADWARNASGNDTAALLVEDLLPAGEVGIRLSESGLRWETRLAATPAGFVPLDAKAWAPVPAAATSVWAIGFDGAAWYQAHGPVIDQAFAAMDPSGQTLETVNSALAAIGMDGGIGGVCSSLRGTVVVALDAGLPFYGGVTIGLPSSPEFDRIVQSLLGLAGMTPPAEGRMALIGMNIPGPEARRITLGGLAIARRNGHWWIATDALFLDDLLRDGAKFADTPAGQALAAAATGAHLVGVGDGRQIGRLGIIGSSVAGSLLGDGRHGGAITQAALDLARTMGPSVVSGRPQDNRFIITGDGLDGGLAGLLPGNFGVAIPVIAAIAIPNLLESRITANEAAAAATLKAGYFPALVQFQAGGYIDTDQDGIGEYGFAGEMAGDPLTGAPDGLRLLPATHRAAIPQLNGYRYYVFLPGTDTSGIAAGEARPAEGADLRERSFVVYAVPLSLQQGRRTFALDATGTVYAMPPGRIPPSITWNLLYGEGTWGADPANPWRPYRR